MANSKLKAEAKSKRRKSSIGSGNSYLPIFQRRSSGSLNRDVQDSLTDSNAQIYESLEEPIDYGVPALFTDSDRRLNRGDADGEDATPDSRLVVAKYHLLLELEFPQRPKHASLDDKWQAVMQVKREKCRRTPEYHFKATSSLNSSFPKKPKKQESQKLDASCMKVCCDLKADIIKGHISYVNDLQKVGVFYQLKCLLRNYSQLLRCSPQPIVCGLICLKNTLRRSEKTRNKMITFEVTEELVLLFYAHTNPELHPLIFECLALIASCSSGTGQLMKFLFSATKGKIVKVAAESRIRCEDGIVSFIVWHLIHTPKLMDIDHLRVKLPIVSAFYNLLSNCLTLDQRVFIIEHLKVYGYDFEALERCLEALGEPSDNDHEAKYMLDSLDELIGKIKVLHIDVQDIADRASVAEARNEVLRDEINQLERKLRQTEHSRSWAMDELETMKKQREKPAAKPQPPTTPKPPTAAPPAAVESPTAPPPPPPPPPPPTAGVRQLSASEDPTYVYYESVYEKLKVDYTGVVSSGSNLPTCHWEPLYAVEGTLFEAAQQEEALKELDIEEFQRKFSHATTPAKGKMYRPGPVAKAPAKTPAANPQAPANAGAQPATKKFELLDDRTAQNLVISKRRLHADDAEICEAIERVDTSVVSGEMAEILYKFLPTSRSELKQVAKHKSRLHQLPEADQFYVRLACIERAPSKLQVIAFLDSFQERCADCAAKIESLTKACIRSLECKVTLQKVLTYFLVLGNFMNTGRRRYAPGFRLTSLDSVSRIADASGKETVFDFVRKTAEKKLSDEEKSSLLRQFSFDPPKVSLPTVSLEVEQLEKGLIQLKDECASSSRLTPRLKTGLELAAKAVPDLVSQQQAAYNLYHQLCGLLGEDAGVTEPDKLFAALSHFVRQIVQPKP